MSVAAGDAQAVSLTMMTEAELTDARAAHASAVRQLWLTGGASLLLLGGGTTLLLTAGEPLDEYKSGDQPALADAQSRDIRRHNIQVAVGWPLIALGAAAAVLGAYQAFSWVSVPELGVDVLPAVAGGAALLQVRGRLE